MEVLTPSKPLRVAVGGVDSKDSKSLRVPGKAIILSLPPHSQGLSLSQSYLSYACCEMISPLGSSDHLASLLGARAGEQWCFSAINNGTAGNYCFSASVLLSFTLLNVSNSPGPEKEKYHLPAER